MLILTKHRESKDLFFSKLFSSHFRKISCTPTIPLTPLSPILAQNRGSGVGTQFLEHHPRTPARSFAHSDHSTAVFSMDCALLRKNTGGTPLRRVVVHFHRQLPFRLLRHQVGANKGINVAVEHAVHIANFK